MKSTVNLCDFINAFENHERTNQFSDEALEALFNYYEDLEAETGDEIELDVIAICCEWTEYTSGELLGDYRHLLDIREWLGENGYDSEDMEEDELREAEEENSELIAEAIADELESKTTVIRLHKSYLIQEF